MARSCALFDVDPNAWSLRLRAILGHASGDESHDATGSGSLPAWYGLHLEVSHATAEVSNSSFGSPRRHFIRSLRRKARHTTARRSYTFPLTSLVSTRACSPYLVPQSRRSFTFVAAAELCGVAQGIDSATRCANRHSFWASASRRSRRGEPQACDFSPSPTARASP